MLSGRVPSGLRAVRRPLSRQEIVYAPISRWATTPHTQKGEGMGSSRTFSGSTFSSRSRSKAVPFLVVLGFMPFFTFGLGVWQVRRLRWKLDMIEQLDEKLNTDTVRLPAQIDTASIPEFAYRKVYVSGVFDHQNEILVGPRTRDGDLGFIVVTPLIRGDDFDTILVNRGFVSQKMHDIHSRPLSQSTDRVEVVGMLRSQEKRSLFTPENTPASGEWVFLDIQQIALHTGAEPVLVDEILEAHAGHISQRLQSGIPVGRAATIELRNQHLTYALTWFSLSIATAIMFARLARRPKRASVSQLRNF